MSEPLLSFRMQLLLILGKRGCNHPWRSSRSPAFADELVSVGLARWGVAETGSLVFHSGATAPVSRRPTCSSACARPVAPGTVSAATAHLEAVAKRLDLVNRQMLAVDERLDRLTESLAGAQEGAEGQRPEPCDVTILRSLPGVGQIVLATLLAEAFEALQRRDYRALRCLAGVAPVTKRSGKSRIVLMRQAAHVRLRNAVYH